MGGNNNVCQVAATVCGGELPAIVGHGTREGRKEEEEEWETDDDEKSPPAVASSDIHPARGSGRATHTRATHTGVNVEKKPPQSVAKAASKMKKRESTLEEKKVIQRFSELEASRDWKGMIGMHAGLFQVLHDLAAPNEILSHYYQIVGNACDYVGDYERGIAMYEKWRAALKEMGRRDLECDAIGGIGELLDKMGKKDKALEHFRECRAISEELGNVNEEMKACDHLGDMYKEMDKFEDAIVLWERCRALALQEGEKEDYTHVVMYHKLGDAYAMTHNNDQARKMFEKCLEIAEADSEEAVEARDMLAAIYGEQNDFERAIPLRTANLQIAVDSGDGETEGWVLHELGQDLVRLKDWPKAKEMNARCLEVAKALGLAELENLTYHQRAWVHYMQEENEAAIAMFEKSLALAMRRGDAKQQHLEYRVLAGVYVSAARYQDARHIYVKDAETMTARMARENLVGPERFEALKLLCKSALGLGSAYQIEILAGHASGVRANASIADEAIAHFEKVLTLAETMQAEFPLEKTGSGMQRLAFQGMCFLLNLQGKKSEAVDCLCRMLDCLFTMEREECASCGKSAVKTDGALICGECQVSRYCSRHHQVMM